MNVGPGSYQPNKTSKTVIGNPTIPRADLRGSSLGFKIQKKKQNAENRQETNIKEYDQEMERLTEAVNKEKEIYNEEKAKLDEMEENFRKIKHAKEVNKKLEDEWALKRQVSLQISKIFLAIRY